MRRSGRVGSGHRGTHAIHRQFDDEAAAATFAPLAAHLAGMAPRDLAHERKPQPHAARALTGPGHPVEGLEDPLALGLRHAGTAVADANLHADDFPSGAP